MSPQTANLVNDTVSMLATMGGTAALRTTQAATPQFKYPQSTAPVLQTEGLVNRGADSINAGINLNKKFSYLEKMQANNVRARMLPDGRVRYYDIETLSKTPGPTRGACNVLEWDPRNCNVRGWYENYNHFGNVNRIHPKNINGQTVISPHYPPTAKDLMK